MRKEVIIGIVIVILINAFGVLTYTVVDKNQKDWQEKVDQEYIRGENMGITKGYSDCEMKQIKE